MSSPLLLSGSIYCRNCFYDLRGLPQDRCPECGCVFDPGDPATFSRVPNPDRIKKFLRAMIPRSADAAASVGAANRLAILESKVRQLQRDNEMLWDHIAWLLCCLLEKEIITEADARKYSTALAERATPVLLDEDSEQLIQKLPIDKEDPFFQILDPEIAVSEEDQGAPPTPHAD